MAKEIVRAPADLSVWRRNMAVLSQRQPKLAMILNDYMARRGHELEHYESVTPAGRWIYGLTQTPFFESSAPPKFGWTKKSRETAIFFQYGVGAPPYLLESIKALPAEALSMVVVEPNIALLAYVLHKIEPYRALPLECALTFLSVPDSATVFLEQTPDTKERLLRAAIADLKDEALMLGLDSYGTYSVSMSLSSVHDGELEAMDGVFGGMAREVKEWSVLRVMQLGNSPEDTMIGLRQMALMSPWISYGYQYSSLLERFRGRPFVVVSAGPSLDKNFELLRDIQDKCVIAATDAVLGKMIRSGIRPHFVCALERGIRTYDVYFAENVEKHSAECSEILLVTQAVCTPKIYGRWPGPKIIIGKAELSLDNWFIVNSIEGQAILSGSSVAHTCFSIGMTLGASSIALIGQDLAYAEDGLSHAGGVFNERIIAALRKTASSPGVIKVPGALGGEVITDEVFLMFLRMFETMITKAHMTTYDCTEGGALKQGAVVEPFASYIAREVAHLPPLETTPLEVVREAGFIADRGSKRDAIAVSLKNSERLMEESEKVIKNVEEQMKRVTAPGLDSKRRMAIAIRVAEMLDEAHIENEMLALVTQSYVALAASELSRVRFLDSVEAVNRWSELYQEIIDAHSAVLKFARQWLEYAAFALDFYAGRELPMTPPSPELAFERLNEIIAAIREGGDKTALRMELDYLLSSVDMARLKWPGRVLWQCGVFLLEEGRAEEAEVLMKAAAEDFKDKKMSHEDMIAFFKDYARVLSTPDLCYTPKYRYAETVLDNAIALGCADAEVREIRKKIAYGEASTYLNYFAVEGGKNRKVAEFLIEREKIYEAILDGDKMRAMRAIWDTVSRYGEYSPKLASSHLNWLAAQIEKSSSSEDEAYKFEVDELLSEIESRPDVAFGSAGRLAGDFLSVLVKRGVELVKIN
ncbi:MAG: DUF115 domain-containing protein [Synergistaceae bacterium]|jgi:hypothetical protein|nr:DUF115 domain-containing protein [Synergistaceae bacterium]